ncbi:hypothetical protein [Yinghuangia seranimata]|uniref:hypothetical protein n=1 Tax=Yinghuangia seranimata TaxID=408067 RepID=UPI00248C0FD0|nr:hypothetical protein [Yinghuangia seranimata]MDI2125937.1 hypothetical protein [Yinghuangia seranimata]
MRDENELNAMFDDLLTDDPPVIVNVAAVKARGARVRRTARIRLAAGSVAVAAVLGGAVVGATVLAKGPASETNPAAVPPFAGLPSPSAPAGGGAPSGKPVSPMDSSVRLLAAVSAHLPAGIVSAEPKPGSPYSMILTREDGSKSVLSFTVGNAKAPGSEPDDMCDPSFMPDRKGAPLPTGCKRDTLPNGAKTISSDWRDGEGKRIISLGLIAPGGTSRGLDSNNNLVEGPGGPDVQLLTVAQLTQLASQPDVYAAMVGAASDAVETPPGSTGRPAS